MDDIKNRNDIISIVDTFYELALQDDTIGIFFNKVVELDRDVHIPIIYDFWESTLFGLATYKGNPMKIHLSLHDLMPLTNNHFDRWITLWEGTIDKMYIGPKANEAISKASQIAQLMKYKIENKNGVL